MRGCQVFWWVFLFFCYVPSLIAHANFFQASLMHRDYLTTPPSSSSSSISSSSSSSSPSVRARLEDGLSRSVARARLLVLDGVTFADYGHGAEYLMRITLGTPGQTLTAVVDTGSSLVWLQCAPCPHCTDPHGPIFRPRHSSTFHPRTATQWCQNLLRNSSSYVASTHPCTFEALYGDLSNAKGILAVDVITLHQPQQANNSQPVRSSFVFGCAHRSENDFFAAGVIGLGPRPLSLPSQLALPKFSYCLVSIHKSTHKTSPIFFGNHNKNMMRYTPLLNPRLNLSSYYYLSLQGISIGNKRLHIPLNTFDFTLERSSGTILDSGTTFTILAAPAFDAIHNTLRSMVKYPLETTIMAPEYEGLTCYNVSNVRKPSFPHFTLHFEGLDLALPLGNTFVRVNRHSVCLAIASAASMLAYDSSLNIIGNIAQQNLHVEIDLQNNIVGFLPTNCAMANNYG